MSRPAANGAMSPAQVQEAMIRMAGFDVPAISSVALLSPQDLDDLQDDPAAVLTRKRADLLRYHLAILNASPAQLDKYSYGFALQDKALERLYKHAFPAGAMEVRHQLDVKAMPLDQVAALLTEWEVPSIAHTVMPGNHA